MPLASPASTRLNPARALRVVGIAIALGGIAHFLGVAMRILKNGAPDGHRIAYVAFIGLFQLGAGVADLIASAAYRDGDRQASRIALLGCALAIGYGVTAAPVMGAAPLVIRLGPVLWALTHLALAFAVLRSRSR